MHATRAFCSFPLKALGILFVAIDILHVGQSRLHVLSEFLSECTVTTHSCSLSYVSRSRPQPTQHLRQIDIPWPGCRALIEAEQEQIVKIVLLLPAMLYFSASHI